MQGGCTLVEQIVFGTEVKVILSGEVWNVTVAARVPVTEYVIRQFTQGMLLLRLGLDVAVRLPVKVRVNAQSVSWAYAWWLVKVQSATSRSVKGRAFRIVVMPNSLRRFAPDGFSGRILD